LYRCNVRTLWDLYWTGKPSEQIAPFRMLSGFDLNVKSDRQLLSKCNFIIKRLVQKSEKQPNTIMHSTVQQRDGFFETAMVHQVYPTESNEEIDKRKIGDLSFATFYDLVKKAEE
jgi:hypothetical protein